MKNISIKIQKAVKKKIGQVFNVGSKVPEDGRYTCVPCGYTHTLKQGQTFPCCFSCLEGKRYEGDSYFKNLGLWELVG